jgi:hypothetical protein
MRKFLGVLVLFGAAGLVACGDKDSAAVGTWTLDTTASFEASRAELLEQLGVPAEDLRKQFDTLRLTLTLKADKTFTSKFVMGPKTEDATGTWSLTEDQVTLRTKTKDGKPAEGDDGKSMSLTLKGDTLGGKTAGRVPMTVVLKRG